MTNENKLYSEDNTEPVNPDEEIKPLEKDDKAQACLFGEKYSKSIQDKEWQDMPEFVQNNIGPARTIYVHFKTREDVEKFSKLMGQPITPLTKSLWYPSPDIFSYMDKRYIDTEIKEEEDAA